MTGENQKKQNENLKTHTRTRAPPYSKHKPEDNNNNNNNSNNNTNKERSTHAPAHAHTHTHTLLIDSYSRRGVYVLAATPKEMCRMVVCCDTPTVLPTARSYATRKGLFAIKTLSQFGFRFVLFCFVLFCFVLFCSLILLVWTVLLAHMEQAYL